MSDKTIKDITAMGEWVVCEAIPAESKVEKTASGLIMPGVKATGQNVNNPNKSGKLIVKYFVVKSIGDKVKDPAFKIGDKVVIDDYDCQMISNGENGAFCLCHSSKIKAVFDCDY
jgi:co-chaperonin GroES (HSP10)